MTKKIILLSFLAALAMFVSAEIYKWVDEEGRVHYSDEPTDKHETHEVEIESGPSPDQIEKAREKAEELKRRSRDAYLTDKIEKQKRLEEEERRLAQEQHCFEARKQLAILQELHLPVYLDTKGQFRAKWEYDTYQGERNYLNDAERASAIQQARNKVVANCKHPDDANEQEIARQRWIRSEYCAKHKAELEALERPSSHAAQQDLENKRRIVDIYCD